MPMSRHGAKSTAAASRSRTKRIQLASASAKRCVKKRSMAPRRAKRGIEARMASPARISTTPNHRSGRFRRGRMKRTARRLPKPMPARMVASMVAKEYAVVARTKRRMRVQRTSAAKAQKPVMAKAAMMKARAARDAASSVRGGRAGREAGFGGGGMRARRPMARAAPPTRSARPPAQKSVPLTPKARMSTKPARTHPSSAPRVLMPYRPPTSRAGFPLRSARCRPSAGRVPPMRKVGGISSAAARRNRAAFRAKAPGAAAW